MDLTGGSHITKILLATLLGSFLLNTYGNGWGAPDDWHPDELTGVAVDMFEARNPNPHYFAYGVLPYYVFAVGAVVPDRAISVVVDPRPPKDSPQFAAWAERRQIRLLRFSRMTSAVFATLMVLVTFAIGRIIFNPSTGLLAAVLFAISTGLVSIGHYATVDSMAGVSYWLACLFALGIWKRTESRWYLLAGFTAGLATGIKADRAVALIPLLLGHAFHKPKRKISDLSLAGLLFAAGFVCANPVLLLVPVEFVDGFTRELAFNALREPPGQTSYGLSIVYLSESVGMPLFVLAIAGGGLACSLLRRSQPRLLAWLLCTFIPYYFVVAGGTFREWYAPLLLPGILLLLAFAVVTVVNQRRRAWAAVAILATTMAAGVTLARTVSVLAQYSDETRDRASRWIESNVPAGASIAVPPQRPKIHAEIHPLLNLTRDRSARRGDLETRTRLDENPTYRVFRTNLRYLESHIGRDSTVSPYIAWFDIMAQQLDRESAQTDQVLQRADYLVIDQKANPELLARLRQPMSGFVEVTRFQPPSQTIFRFTPVLVNPDLVIFRRSALLP